MPKISEDIIRTVLEQAKIEDVVGDFVTLRKAGVNMTGICPFHDDQHDGNFIVRPSTLSPGTAGRNTYHCFVCMRTGEGGGPVDFLMKADGMSFPDAIRYLGKKYSIDVDNIPLNWTPPPPKPIPPPKPMLAMDRRWVKPLMTGYNQNNFTLWYGRLPWNEHQRSRMKQTLWEYCVGCWHDGRAVFWQIDHDGIPRAAKLMKYEPDGRRYHEKKGEKNATGWLYNQDGYRDACQPQDHTILHPLFGAHLLKRYPEAKVNVVESEKTALIMANYFGNPEQQLWLACGGLKFLKIESMQPLIDQGRTVWLWPDKDGVKGWEEVADKLGSPNVQVYTKFFDACWEPEDGDKADIADIAVRMLYHPDWVPREIKAEGEQGETDSNAEAASDHGATLPPPPEGVTDEAWLEHLKIVRQIGDYELAHPNDDPFIDPEELRDPRLHQWREVLRQRYNFNKTRNNGKK